MNNQKLKEILSKFKDGEERYKKSPTFNVTVRALLNGTDPILIIDQLIQMNENTSALFDKFLNEVGTKVFNT